MNELAFLFRSFIHPCISNACLLACMLARSLVQVRSPQKLQRNRITLFSCFSAARLMLVAYIQMMNKSVTAYTRVALVIHHQTKQLFQIFSNFFLYLISKTFLIMILYSVFYSRFRFLSLFLSLSSSIYLSISLPFAPLTYILFSFALLYFNT